MVRPCVARGFRRSRQLRSCINVSGLRLERAPACLTLPNAKRSAIANSGVALEEGEETPSSAAFAICFRSEIGCTRRGREQDQPSRRFLPWTWFSTLQRHEGSCRVQHYGPFERRVARVATSGPSLGRKRPRRAAIAGRYRREPSSPAPEAAQAFKGPNRP
jgi:hypothetical protein